MKFNGVICMHFQKHLTKRCKSENCVLRMSPNLGSWLAIDCESYKRQANHRDEICDFFVLVGLSRTCLFVVEMKGGRLDLKKARSQIQRGIVLAESHGLNVE